MDESSSGITSDAHGIQIVNLALAEALITQEQWVQALAVQSEEFASGRWVRSLTTILQALGYLTSEQLEALRARVRQAGGRFTFQAADPTPPTRRAPAVAERGAPTFGPYLILRELGRGPHGVVHEAVDSRLKRKVALKIFPSTPEAAPPQRAREEQRFLQEAGRMRELPRDARLVQVYEAGALQGTRYIAMEFVEGIDLPRWWALPASQPHRISVLREIARALQQAHRKGFTHDELKPRNVIVDARNRPHLTDFGTARAARRDARAAVNLGSRLWGAAAYLSPEQAVGERPPDARSNVYSLGVMLYEIMAGQPPFAEESPVQGLLKAMSGDVRRPSSLMRVPAAAEAERALERICLRAMARAPENRYPTAEAFAEDLSLWLRGRSPSVARRGRGRLWAAAGGILAAAAAAFLLLLRPGGAPATAPPPPPPAAAARAAAPPLPPPPGLKYLGNNARGHAEYRNLNDDSVMILVPSGSFILGSARGQANEKPERTVHLDAFFIDRTEVTVAQFRRFVEATGYVTDAEKQGWATVVKDGDRSRRPGAGWRDPGFPQEGSHPVTGVSWTDASEYCRWAGKRLPTEAEWEKAARGTDGRLYPWGDEWDSSKTNAENRFGGTLPAGTFAEDASPYGVLELSGSLSEHAADWFLDAYHQVGEPRNPRGPAEGTVRVVKGGSWADTGFQGRAPRRSGAPPAGIGNVHGFRGALTPDR